MDEKRQFPRYYPNKKNRPKVTFTFRRNIIIDIHTINISDGGLMGYASSIENFLGIEDQNIERIEIAFPNEKPFRCSGRILRLQPIINENKCYCAVEFKTTEEGRETDLIYNELLDCDEALIDRVKQVDNYCYIHDLETQATMRDRAYTSFEDITLHLSTEERWIFFELLDEMKQHEPDYPDTLKSSFIQLCRLGSRRNNPTNRKLK